MSVSSQSSPGSPVEVEIGDKLIAMTSAWEEYSQQYNNFVNELGMLVLSKTLVNLRGYPSRVTIPVQNEKGEITHGIQVPAGRSIRSMLDGEKPEPWEVNRTIITNVERGAVEVANGYSEEDYDGLSSILFKIGNILEIETVKDQPA